MSEASKSWIFDLVVPARSTVEAPSTVIEAEVTELFDRFRRPMLRYLNSLGLCVQDGEEIVQEVFLSLFQHLRQKKSRENLRGWLFRVAHNIALKKRSANHASLELGGKELVLEQCCDPQPSPEELLSIEERRLRLLAVLKALPRQEQYCLYLRAEGLPYREIAEVLDISLGSVCKSLTRAIGRLSSADRR